MKDLLKLFLMIVILLTAGGVYAAKYDIKKMTPEVQQALESRRSRFDQLHNLKAKGIVGENNNGYLELLQKDSAVKVLVDAENQDRKLIYKAIAEQNGVEGQLDVIESVFAQVQRDKAESGDKIQDDQGGWIQK